MKENIGLDVSLKVTAVSIRRDGKRMWRGKCASDPKVIAELVRKRAPAVERIVFETGPLARKLAVTKHSMLKSGEFFNPSIGAAA